MKIEIIETIDQIDSSEWNRLVRDRSFASWRWLQVTEALISKQQVRYIVLRGNSTLQAAAVCSIQNRFHSRLLQSMMGWLPRYFPYLRCDMPISATEGLFFSNEAQLEVVFPKLLRGIKAILRQEHALFYSFDHFLPADPVWMCLQANHFHRFEHVSETYLDIDWTSFESFLTTLPKIEYERFLQTQSQMERQGIKIELTDPHLEDMNVLQQLTIDLSRYVKKPYIYSRDLFVPAHELMDKDFKLIVAHQYGRAIGCVAMLCDTHQWIVRWPGLDLQCELGVQVYDGLLSECIRQAIIAKGQRLYLGVIDLGTIQHFGSTIEKRMGAAAVRSRPLHWLAGRLLGLTANPEASQA
jgi:predicted N-acyltransferase